MKKKIFIIASIVVSLIVIAFISIAIIQNITYEKSFNVAINRINNLLRDTKKYLSKYNYNLEGNVKVNAKYKGAHGEIYPSYFQYTFLIDEEKNNLTFENNGWYFTKDIDTSIIKIFNNINIDNLDKIINVKEKSIKSNKIDILLENDNINKILGTNFKNTKMTIETYGIIIKKVSAINLILDDIKINYKDGTILISKDNNKLRIKLNSLGYSLNINDNLKMNVFLNEDKDQYNIVIYDKVFYLECLNNKVNFSTNTEAAIYNGLDLEIIFDNIDLNQKMETEEKEIPIFRYFNELNFNIWE